jgi:spermidine synthase
MIARARRTSAVAEEPASVVALAPAVAATTVFLASGAVLMLEILAVRLLAPYVGLTLETTTSIIGAVLAGIAIGAAVGGSFADRTDPRRLLVGLLVAGGLLALLTVPVVRLLGPQARGHGNFAALLVTLASLVPSAAVLSAVSPTVARLQLRDLHESGRTVGRLSAFATAGALVGTFGTGFVIVPLMPVSTAVLVIGLALAASGLVLGAHLHAFGRGAVVAALLVTVAFGALAATRDSPCDADTSYHCAAIAADPGHPTGRLLKLDGITNSYVDLKDPTILPLAYTRWMANAMLTAAPRGPVDAVFVGGGGFTLPRWLLATHRGSTARVLEVDGKLVDLDREQLGLRTTPSLRAVVGDARMTMRDVPDGRADVVVGDAFSGLTVPWHLLTEEWLEQVKRVLKPDGLYLLNLIDFDELELAKAEIATLGEAFREVRVVAAPDGEGGPKAGNLVVIASDRDLSGFDFSADEAVDFGADATRDFAKGGTLLRDDYAPVDQLVAPPPGT